ncbi:MAG: metallophosphoesterase [Kiritimatiellia bacterium]|jgi:3',5'-cyclic AMP phosphodiesterase CpdA|nr:metallophosphoesterase [Kiritimatiellia bacterium]
MKIGISRAEFLKACGFALSTLTVSALQAEDSRPAATSRTRPFRFAIASDLHFGQVDTDYHNTTAALVAALNEEAGGRGLNAVFLNGDLVHDTANMYGELKDALKRLSTPVYVTKGNHDFATPEHSWKDAWGYPSNHTVDMGDLAFVLADTSAGADGGIYRPADVNWLTEELERLQKKTMIFVMLHIAQRPRYIQGWPKWGIRDKDAEAGQAVMTLLESCSNVKAIFHGHNHNETGVYRSGGKKYFFDSHIGGSFGNKKGYRIVEIDAKNAVTTYQYNMEQSVIMNQDAI